MLSMDSGLRRNDGGGLQAVGLAALYLAPRRYFASRGPLQDRPALLLAAALVGITDVMDYIDQNIADAVHAPQALIMVWAMARMLVYPGYAEAQAGTATSDMVLLVFLLWSCWTSYCAATTVYTLDPRKARFWFLLLPLGFYLMVLSASGTLYATFT